MLTGGGVDRSNFQKLAEPQNEDLQTAFRKGAGAQETNRAHAPRSRRKDGWDGGCLRLRVAGGGAVVFTSVLAGADAEQMFTRVDRRARTLMLRSFNSFAPFIEAVEYVVLHFIQVWNASVDAMVLNSMLRERFLPTTAVAGGSVGAGSRHAAVPHAETPD
jgi:hypothetical protein